MSSFRGQSTAFWTLVAANALLVLATFLWFPLDQLRGGQALPVPETEMPAWQMGLAAAGAALVMYGVLGLVGLSFARELGLPGVCRAGAGRWHLYVLPMLMGLGVGVLMAAVDRLFAEAGLGQPFPHPPFPLSLVASATAGIGEEILFRLFFLGLWAWLLDLVLWRWMGVGTAFGVANSLAALAFAAAHLPAAMVLFGAASPVELPAPVLAELLLLNGLVGLVAGDRFLKDGLVAAVGIHFWADVIWHVVWPAVGVF